MFDETTGHQVYRLDLPMDEKRVSGVVVSPLVVDHLVIATDVDGGVRVLRIKRAD